MDLVKGGRNSGTYSYEMELRREVEADIISWQELKRKLLYYK